MADRMGTIVMVCLLAGTRRHKPNLQQEGSGLLPVTRVPFPDDWGGYS